jgi:hypothetical protein
VTDSAAEPAAAPLHAMLRGGLAWPDGLAPDAFVEQARLHGVDVLLLDLATRAGAVAGWPAAAVEPLRAATRVAAALELGRREALVRLLAQCAGAGVRPVLLKGTALAYTLYREPHLRPRVDVDLLVHADEKDAVARLLQRDGYETTLFQGGDLVNAQASYWKSLPAGGSMTIDLHWRISTSPLFAHVLDPAHVRSAAIAVPALGAAALAPCHADALLHACIHRAPMAARRVGSDRRGNRLIWLYDLHLLAAALDASGWQRFAHEAERHRLRGICRDALAAAARCLGTAVPGEVDARLSAPADEPSMSLLRGGRWELKRAELASLPTFAERLRYVRETVLPAPEYMLAHYGTRRRWLLPALYVRRAFGWLAR